MIGRKGEVNSITNKMCSVQASCMHRLILLCLQKYLKELLNYRRSSQEHTDFFFPNSAEHKHFPFTLWLLCQCEKICGYLNEELSVQF